MVWRSVAMACLILGALGPGLQNARAAQERGTATVILHPRVCDEVPAGGDWYGTCHDERFFGGTIPLQPAGGGAPIHGVHDGDGGVVFSVAPGEYDWLTIPGHSLDGGEFYCAETTAPAVEIPAFPLFLGAGDSVTCDSYVVPSCLAADPASCAAADARAALSRADRARPAAIHTGECGDLGDAVAEVTAIAFPEAEPAGAVDGLPVENSFTRLDLPLDDILAAHHVVAVFAGPAGPADDTLVACGAVGGIVTEDGALAVGLREVDGSGLSGIAYLAPDGEQTLVTVFLAEDLVGATATPDAD